MARSVLVGSAVCCILAAAIIFATACGSVDVTLNASKTKKTDTRTRAVTQPVREIVVDADAGDLDLTGTGARLRIKQTRHYNKIPPKLTETVKDGRLTVTSRCAERSCRDDLRIAVPRGVKMRATTDAGDVTTEGLRSPDVQVESSAGDLQLDLAAAPDRVDARTDAGDIDLAVPAGAYAIDAGTEAGDLDVHGLTRDDRAPRSLSAQSEAGDVTVYAR